MHSDRQEENRRFSSKAIFAEHRATMSDHHFDGHFPDEAEQNEITGPVITALIVLGAIILVIWAWS